MKLEDTEAYFRQKIDLLGDLAEPVEVAMLLGLIEYVKRLSKENEKLTALNRHYLHHFYGGSVEKFRKDFGYLME